MQAEQRAALDHRLDDDAFARALCEHMPLDVGIARIVRVLWAAGVETFESCEGGTGHAYPEPTVRFFGERAAGFHALSVAMAHGLAVGSLRRTWPIVDGEPTGPWWEMTFHHGPV